MRQTARLSAPQLARLRRLGRLTPGDIVNVFKRFKTLDLDANRDAGWMNWSLKVSLSRAQHIG